MKEHSGKSSNVFANLNVLFLFECVGIVHTVHVKASEHVEGRE